MPAGVAGIGCVQETVLMFLVPASDPDEPSVYLRVE